MDGVTLHGDTVVGALLIVNSILTGIVGWVGKRFVSSVRELEKELSGFKLATHARLSVLESRQYPPIYNAEVSP